jgi:putative transposase
VRELIEERGCELLYVPPYSPDLNPIEHAFSKMKALMRKRGAGTRETLIGAMGAGCPRSPRGTPPASSATAATEFWPNYFDRRSRGCLRRVGNDTMRFLAAREGSVSVKTRRSYSADLSEEEWAILQPLVPQAKPGGRPRTHQTRELLDAIFYVVRSGCAWRLLPHDFPPWQTAYHYFRVWRIDGTWERIHATLRQLSRLKEKVAKKPRARPSWIASR